MAGKKDKKKEEAFYSFEEALKELQVNEDELNRMVSEGELSALREGDVIKFKKADIDDLKSGRITEPTVLLPTEDLLGLSEPKEKESLAEEPLGVTEEVPLADTDITIPTEEEKLPEISPEDQKTFIEEETAAVTTPLGGPAEPEAAVEEVVPEAVETVAEEVVEKAPPPEAKLRPGRVRAITAPPPEIKIHPIFIIMIGFTFLVLLFIGSLLSDTFRISTGKANFPVGITRELGKLAVSIFGIKDETGEDINLDKYKP